jgi:hypothetical protein
MAESERWRHQNPKHTDFALLLQTLCVVDVDSHALANVLEQTFPILLNVARERTSKGVHYFFSRSPLADNDGYYDARSPVLNGVDFKSRTATGTGGVIVTAPTKTRGPFAESSGLVRVLRDS